MEGFSAATAEVGRAKAAKDKLIATIDPPSTLSDLDAVFLPIFSS